MLESAGKHQVLIFVHSRKETAKTARFLKEEALREDKLSMFMKVCLPVAPLCSAQVLCWLAHQSLANCHMLFSLAW